MSEAPERLCLVGMSGVGKSFQAKRLEQVGWQRHDCDTEIAQHLAELVPPSAGEPVHGVGRWMGMPWTAGFEEREARYLALEERVTRACLERSLATPGPHVLDTTGSVIYLGAPLLAALQEHCLVVYLRAVEDEQAMLARYIAEPKPVAWGGLFAALPGESAAAALPRCYRELLRTRDERYLALAHVVIEAERLARPRAELLRELARRA